MWRADTGTEGETPIGRVRNSAPWDRASLPGRAVPRRARALTVTALCLVALLALRGCTVPDLGSVDVGCDPTTPPPPRRPGAARHISSQRGGRPITLCISLSRCRQGG